jgi:hypothetical protein
MQNRVIITYNLGACNKILFIYKYNNKLKKIIVILMFLFYLTVKLLYNNEKEKYTNKKRK